MCRTHLKTEGGRGQHFEELRATKTTDGKNVPMTMASSLLPDIFSENRGLVVGHFAA